MFTMNFRNAPVYIYVYNLPVNEDVNKLLVKATART